MTFSQIPVSPPGYITFSKLYLHNPLNFYSQAWKTYGDLIRFKALPGLSVYFAVHPQAVEHILQSHGQVYKKAEIVHKPLSLLLGHGILISEGETWLRQRRLMQPAFHRQSLIKLASVMTSFAQKRVEMWKIYVSGSEINLAEEMQQLTLQIVGESLFSADLGDNINFAYSFRRTAEFINHQINSPFKLPLWVPTLQNRQFIHNRNVLNEIAMNLIRGRRQQQSKPDDLLSMLMDAQDADTGERMTDLELLDEVMTLLVAGHETVSVTLTWAFYLIGKHPEILQKLQHEIETVLNGRPPSPADYMQLSYTRMIIEETLRLYPPVWGLSRETIKDDEIQGYQIPKKALVLVPAYLTHRHPKFWDKPEEFIPERFTEAEASKRHKFAYYPFGGGSRICIGNQFALMEATLILSTLVQCFDLQTASDKLVEVDTTFTLRPKNGLAMRLIKR